MKRFVAALLCLIMVLMLFPATALASYSTVSNRGVKLELPKEKEYYDHPFEARVESGSSYGAIYFMPKPQKGNGHLGTVDSGTIVTILARRGAFFFFETEDGEQGWNGRGFFAYYKDENGNKVVPDFPMVSSKGDMLVFPRDREYLDEPFTKEVRSCGRIYLMPMPEAGHGNLGMVEDGEEVTVLADMMGFYFFRTEDGRYGWNGKIYFK